MSNSRLWVKVFAVIPIVCRPIAARAQTPAVRDKPDCAPAEAKLAQTSGGETLLETLQTLVDCPDAGPRALAAKWAKLPSDSAAIAELGGASRRISDHRLMEAVRHVAVQTDAPLRLRLLALAVLAGQYDPSISASAYQPAGSAVPGLAVLSWGEVTEGAGRYGTQPVGDAGRAQILQTLRQLQSNDPDENIRRIATQMLGHLTSGS